MIIVYNAAVEKTIDYDRHRIAWDARKSPYAPETVSNYNFKLLWSFDPVSDFSFIQSNSTDVVIDGATGPLYYVHDYPHPAHDKDRWYKIRAINKTNPNDYLDTESLSIQNYKSDGIIKTIVYNEYLLNNIYIGEPSYLLKKKVDGSRCPECWNEFQQQRMKGNCNTCHGTGFYDGYYRPIEVQIAYDSNPKVAELDQTIEIHSTTIRGRCSCFPTIYTKDMIISKDGNDRYVVLKVDITKLPNVACKRGTGSGDQFHVSQILTLAT